MSTVTPPSSADRLRRVRRVWRIGTPVVALLSGALFAVSAESSEGTDLRPGRYSDLASIVAGESEEVERLQRRAVQLDEEVHRLTTAVEDRAVSRITGRVRALEGPAGHAAVTGPGLTVTLADAPESVVGSSEVDVNYLVVHQQDIQAVVNALWLGGASAITLQGQRIITTTGIKCSGNAVRLHGIPYAQPYRISAVGDQRALSAALAQSDYLQVYREQAARPDIAIGWDLQAEDRIEAPGYAAPVEMAYARPAG